MWKDGGPGPVRVEAETRTVLHKPGPPGPPKPEVAGRPRPHGAPRGCGPPTPGALGLASELREDSLQSHNLLHSLPAPR